MTVQLTGKGNDNSRDTFDNENPTPSILTGDSLHFGNPLDDS